VAAAAAEPLHHRVGLGWRTPLASGILSHLDSIDVVEIIADDLFEAKRSTLSAMQTLARQLPVVVHGLSLGLASALAADRKRMKAMARVLDALKPAFWSEHLAFVRGAGLEIGHLAAPPRSEATLSGLARNVTESARITGARPLLENIATLVTPAGSTLDEAEFVRQALEAADADLLLDLHNLHANAHNFGFDAQRFLEQIPAARIRAIHLAGGRWVGSASGKQRLVDDHLHAVPEAVYELLALVAARATRPLTVIVERDGHYPEFSQLLAEVERARDVLRSARSAESTPSPSAEKAHGRPATTALTAPIEAYLARLYVERTTRELFFRDRAAAFRESGLDPATWALICELDESDLEFAAGSYEHKRRGSRRVSDASR